MKSLLLLVFIVAGSICCAQTIRKERLDSVLNHIEQYNQSLGNVSVYKDGKEVYNRSFGQSKVRDLTFDEHTSYQIGSVTKLVTSVLLWKLVEQGKLNLEEKLSTYFPDIPNADKIHLSQILSHNSGLGDYTSIGEGEPWLIEKRSVDTILSVIRHGKPLFEPGTDMRYSNSGFYLLTKIIEKCYKKPYAKIVEKEIVKPLKLKDFRSFDNYNNNYFRSYKFIKEWIEVPDFYPQNIIGVGDILATPRDLNNFLEGLFAGKLLKKETLEKMKAGKDNNGFGKGFMYIPYKKNVFLGHGGDTYGTHTLAGYNVQDKIAISITINGQRYEHNAVYIAILGAIYDPELKLPEFETNVLKLSPEQLKQYEGLYSSADFPLKIKIFQEDGELYGQADGQGAFPLTCYKEDKFMFEAAQIYMDFSPGQDSMFYRQRSNEVNFKRPKAEQVKE